MPSQNTMANAEQEPSRNRRRGRQRIPDAPSEEVLTRGRETLGGLTDIIGMNTLGALHGALRTTSPHQEVALYANPESRVVSSVDITDLQRTLGILAIRKELPTDIDTNELHTALNAKKDELLEKERQEELARKAQAAKEKERQKEQAARKKAKEDRKARRRKRIREIGTGVASVVCVSAFASVAIVGYDIYTENKRKEQIVYEQTHTLNTEPSRYSYAGWRVRYPEIPQDTKFSLLPEEQLSIVTIKENSPLNLTEGNNTITTGIMIKRYTRQDGTKIPKLIIALEDPKTAGYKNEEKLLHAPNTKGLTNTRVVTLENTGGKVFHIAIFEQKIPGEDKTIFVILPVSPSKTIA